MFLVSVGGWLLALIGLSGLIAVFMEVGDEKIEGSKIQPRNIVFWSFICLLAGGLIIFH